MAGVAPTAGPARRQPRPTTTHWPAGRGGWAAAGRPWTPPWRPERSAVPPWVTRGESESEDRMEATTTVTTTGNPVPTEAELLEYLSGLPPDDRLPTLLDWAAGADADRAGLAIRVL